MDNVFIYICLPIFIYAYRERDIEREREKEKRRKNNVCVCVCLWARKIPDNFWQLHNGGLLAPQCSQRSNKWGIAQGSTNQR